ncbi:MAG: NAD(+)/NADH kinase [Oscillospiraceae bacterium]|jgi:NAD+ kinase|nr:NAD(+)/NADH kinase [Oscillospiraceae bacterium]
MKSIVLCANARRDDGLEVTRRVADMAQDAGVEAHILTLMDAEGREIQTERAKLAEWLREAELMLAFGGDGTMLRAAKLVVGTETPVLGINMGGKGFLAELELSQLDAIPEILRGDFKRERRMTLEAELTRNGTTIARDIAINDAVLSGGGKVVKLTIFGDGHQISSFAGDGVIVSTPTGSTAYSMAAGGPIVEPTAQNIIITPICAHYLEAKPYVLVSDRRVSVEVGSGKKNSAFFTADGKDRRIVKSGDRLNIKKSKKTVCFARLAGRSFYKRVSEKLGESN